MDQGIVSDFLAHQAWRHVPELGYPSKEMIQKAEELYSAYGGRLPSPPQLGPLNPSKKLEAFVAEFSSGINQFLQRSQDPKALSAFTTGTSWDKLEEQATKAWAAYNNHKSRKRNWRRPFEVLDNAAEKIMTRCCVEFLLELLPNGEYSSLLSGGLTLAYNTAVRKEKFPENILDLFESLSDRAEQTKANIQLYSRDSHLHAKSEELYMAVIDCVRHSTAWLDKPSATESFKAFFQQSKYGSKWEDAKANLDQKVKEFDDTVNMCMRRQINQINETIQCLQRNTQGLCSTTYSMLAGLKRDFTAFFDLLQFQAAQAQKPSNPVHTTNVSHTGTYQPTPPPPPPITVLAWQVGNSCLAIDYRNRHPSPGQPFPADPIDLAIRDLNSDIDTAMYHIPPYLEREKMGYMSSTPRFASWLRSTTSQLLILHEQLQPTNSSLSTLSHLCGLISSILQPNDPSQAPIQGLWTLLFFCGLHTSANSTLQGGLGLIRGIALQLISSLPNLTLQLTPSPSIPDLATLYNLLLSEDEYVPSDTGSSALQATSLIFSLMLSQLRAGMIFILIDGAHWNGTQVRSSDMGAVIRYLYQLVGKLRRARRGLVLKVLATNPGARQRVDWGIPGTDFVNGDEFEASIGWYGERGIELENDLYMERLVVAWGFDGVAEQVVRGFGQ